jgi:hypothetical protein
VAALYNGKKFRLLGLEYLNPAGMICFYQKYAPLQFADMRMNGGGGNIIRHRICARFRAKRPGPGFRDYPGPGRKKPGA